MANLIKKLSKKKRTEIEKFLKKRFKQLKDMRQELDDDIEEEVDLYNNKDDAIDNEKEEYETQLKVPYIYVVTQTVVARLKETLFGSDNYLRLYVEDKKIKGIERDIQDFLQAKLDKMKIRDRSRDFLEDALVKRTAWLQARPNKKSKNNFKVEFDIIDWFNFWFDTRVIKIEDSDVFVRKIKKLYTIKQNSIYSNIEDVLKTVPPDNDTKERQQYEAKHGAGVDHGNSKFVYYEEGGNSPIDEVELLEYYGVYNFGTDKKSDIKEVIFTMANREVLIRAETNDIKTKRKRPFFPIRPLRQANSLIAKSIPQLTKDEQKQLNEVVSLRMDNFKTQIKLLFKYRKDADIDFDECFAAGGNMIGYGESPDDISNFDVPDKLREASAMATELIGAMQQTIGATDYVQGTNATGVTDTASGIQQLTNQSLFKFAMMADNVYYDLLDFINYTLLLHVIYGKDQMILKNINLKPLIDLDLEDLEDSYYIDMSLNDIAVRRDVQRAQFINAINIILGILTQVGGNPKALLKQVMERLDMENIDEILKLPPEEEQMVQAILPVIKQNPGLIQMILQYVEQQGKGQASGGSMLANPQATSGATPEETVNNQNPERVIE